MCPVEGCETKFYHTCTMYRHLRTKHEWPQEQISEYRLSVKYVDAPNVSRTTIRRLAKRKEIQAQERESVGLTSSDFESLVAESSVEYVTSDLESAAPSAPDAVMTVSIKTAEEASKADQDNTETSHDTSSEAHTGVQNVVNMSDADQQACEYIIAVISEADQGGGAETKPESSQYS